MRNPYVASVVRFVVLAVLAWLLLGGLPAAVPGNPPMDVSMMQQRPVSVIIAEYGARTPLNLAKLVGFGLVPAILLGAAAGRRPGSALDRVLQAPLLLLLAMSPVALALAGVYLLGLQARLPIQSAALAGMVLAVLPWLARAVREGVADARSEEQGAIDAPTAVLGSTGRILQQTGNLLTATFLLELIAPYPGLGRLLIDALMQRDAPVVLGIMPVAIFGALLAHLLGDLLVAYTARQERPPTAPSTTWVIAGAVMATALLLTTLLSFGTPHAIDLAQRMMAPGTPGHPLGTDHLGRDVLGLLSGGARTTLMIGLMATLVAAVGGAVAGVIGGLTGRIGAAILAPRLHGITLLPALLLATIITLVVRPSIPLLIFVLGLTGIPLMAYPIRRLVAAPKESSSRRGALRAILGSLALLLGQALLIEALLSSLGIGVQPPTSSLGAVLAMARPYLRQAPHLLFWPSAVLTIGVGGLFILGHTLTDAAGRESGE